MPRVTSEATAEGSIRIMISGDLAVETAAAVEDELLAVITRETGRTFVLDLAKVSFCDCAGLRLLVRLREEALAVGSGVRIVATSPQVTWLLAASGRSDLLEDGTIGGG